jgi:hypothetical protein
MCSSTLSLTSVLDGVGGQCHALGAVPPRKEPHYPLDRRLDGLQGWSGWVWKISLPPAFNRWTIQATASHYINYAIPAPIDCVHSVNKHKYQSDIHV